MVDNDALLRKMNREIGEISISLKDFKKTTDRQLKNINVRLDTGLETFQEIRQNCMSAKHRFEKVELVDAQQDERLDELENNGVPKKTRLQIIANTILAVVNMIISAWQRVPA